MSQEKKNEKSSENSSGSKKTIINQETAPTVSQTSKQDDVVVPELAKINEALQIANKSVLQTKGHASAVSADADIIRDTLQVVTADAASVKTHASAAAASAKTAKKNSDLTIEAATTASANAKTTSQAASGAQSDVAAISQHLSFAEKAATEAKSGAGAVLDHVKTASEQLANVNELTTKLETNAKTAEANAAKAVGHTQDIETSVKNVKNSEVAASSSADSAKKDSSSIQSALKQANGTLNETNEALSSANGYAADAAKACSEAKEAAKKAKTEADNAVQAHNMSTTAGLAGSFNQKAHSASRTQNIWMGGLLVALVAIGIIGWFRFDTVAGIVKELLDKDGTTIEKILAVFSVQGILTILSLVAPVWFAWMSTRMISKYFHLSEDYSYKAALAKAYIGFKEQSEGLDPVFQERLFAAAVTQLDANPIRFIDPSFSHPGSPMQDLFQQPFMQAAMENPTFKERFVGWFQNTYKKSFPLPAINLAMETFHQPSGSPEPKPDIHPVQPSKVNDGK